MEKIMKSPHSRKLLQLQEGEIPRATLPSSITHSPDPILTPSSVAPGNDTPSAGFRKSPPPFKLNTPFDSSMALTILVLLTALFFMAFFSVYIRRFAEDSSSRPSSDLTRRRRSGSPSPSRYRQSQKGLDPSTVSSLPVVLYSRGGAAEGKRYPNDVVDCVICLTEFEEGEVVKMIPYCRHVFHPSCVDTWLTTHVSCPLCRSTRIRPADGVCLGVEREDAHRFPSVLGYVGPPLAGGVRRTCSCSSLGGGEGDNDHVYVDAVVASLERSTSF